MRGRTLLTWPVVAVLLQAVETRGLDPDWDAMAYTPHAVYQAVDANGFNVFQTNFPVRMRGIILNRPGDMLDGLPGADPFMGGQWQIVVQAIDPDDYGGTTLWMGQNVGKISGEGSYSDAAWLSELERLNRDPATGRAFRPGDRVEVRARAPGQFYRGKTNINEQHIILPDADFDVILLQANAGLPAPQDVTLADLKDAEDQFLFDPDRLTGPEHYQGAVVRIQNVCFVDPAAWGPGGQLLIHDGMERTFPVLLGRSEGFTRYPAPVPPFDIVGILDQEDSVEGDGFTSGYRLWAMNYDGEQFFLDRYVDPDFDRDGDVDELDAGYFSSCATGPAVPQDDTECQRADFDADGDVDQDDFGVLQRCFSGTDELVDPLCDR